MDKGDFVQTLKKYKQEISAARKRCEKVPGKQIQARAFLDQLEALATKWFDEIEPSLRSTLPPDEEVLSQYREPLGKILELSGGKPSSRLVQTILDAILHSFHVDIVVPVQKHRGVLSKFPGLDAVLGHASGLEVGYLKEAVECAREGKRRAALVLGWCAAVNRLHLYVEEQGFAKFHQASVQMSAIQKGRYRRFNKKFEIHNVSDLRMSVFDRDLLWVLEFLGAIDGNQHERLEICVTLRDTCAHPGEATVSEENVLSFFSDIDNLVFANPKFSLGSNQETGVSEDRDE